MDQPSARTLDRLLADGELSGPEADAIFERIHAAVEDGERGRHRRVAIWLGSSVAVAAAVLLVLIRPTAAPRSEFAPRGQVANAFRLDAVCSQGTLAACPSSANLTFALSGEHAPRFLSAYAEPLDGQTDRVWYFSSDTPSPALLGAAASQTRVFDRGVRLSGSHRPGHYRIHAFLADRPLSRAEMLATPTARAVRSATQYDLFVQE